MWAELNGELLNHWKMCVSELDHWKWMKEMYIPSPPWFLGPVGHTTSCLPYIAIDLKASALRNSPRWRGHILEVLYQALHMAGRIWWRNNEPWGQSQLVHLQGIIVCYFCLDDSYVTWTSWCHRALWNFTHNFEPIHSKIHFLRGVKGISSYHILELWYIKS